MLRQVTISNGMTDVFALAKKHPDETIKKALLYAPCAATTMFERMPQR